MNDDITERFFLVNNNEVLFPPYTNEIKLTNAPSKYEDQFSDYNYICFNDIKPLIDKYFTFSNEIINCKKILLDKYKLNPNSTCAIMYRGNDKCTETQQPSYEDVIEKTKEVLQINPDLTQIFLQTDEREFSIAFRNAFPETIVFAEIPDTPKCQSSMQYIIPQNDRLEIQQYYIASLSIISECNKVIHTSGNGEMFITLFRNNTKGMHQYLRPCKTYLWDVNNSPNPSYDPNQTYFWIDN